MPIPIKISELRFGLEASPGFQGNRLAPHEIINIEVNSEGRAVLRKGYTESEQEFEGEGDQLAVIHFVRDRNYDGVSQYKRFDREVTHSIFGRRLFIADPTDLTQNVWIDADTNAEYVWELPKPLFAPEVELDISEIGTAGIVAVETTPTPMPNTGGHVRIACDSETRVKVDVVNIQGQVVNTLRPAGNLPAVAGHENYYTLPLGNTEYTWDGRNKIAEQVASGQYFIDVKYLDEDDEVQNYVVLKNVLLSQEDADDDVDVDDLIDGGDLEPGHGFRRGIFTICYTYYSAKHGIETPPSPISTIRIVASSNPNRESRTIATVRITNYLNDLPLWCDQVRFYVKRLGNQPTQLEPKDIPYDFTYIGGPGREDLNEDIRDEFGWNNERIEKPFDFLRTKEFETSPDQRGLQHILSYVGRVWGYDADLHTIRFSLIERPDVMPYDDARLPHAVRIDGSWNARVTGMHVIPPSGGLYVFFPRAIRTIRGQQIITGLFQLNISPETDIDASGGVNGRGTRSPHSIVSWGSMVFYLDTDRKIYSLGGEHSLQTEEMSLSIQPFLDAATDEDIRNARAEIWQSRYHLMLSDRTYILDLQRNYWTIWNVPIKSIVHSVGGDNDEDILYALVDNNVQELYTGEVPEDTEWMWITNYVELPRYSRVSEVVLPHPEKMPVDIEMRVETERMLTDWKTYQPSAGNKFRLGTFAQTDTRARVHIRGTGEIPRLNELYIGVN